MNRRRKSTFHGPGAIQEGSGNLQINVHDNRMTILAACVVGIVFGTTLAVVLLSGGSGKKDTPANTPDTSTSSATETTRTDTTLTGNLVNDDSGLCLRAPGTAPGLVPVLATCTKTPDRTWTLPTAHDNSEARALRNNHSARCLTTTGTENSAPVPQLPCTTSPNAHWQVLWGTGDRAGHFMLRNTANAKCLMAQGTDQNTPTAQISCGEQYADQWWHVTR
ncbi:RICIN domain-containing protein [Streptomyces acidiscabies]|uniref:RICIN domain-containing protein n=1 Tax=Streptomyces acidiscabies TaxID=42234 RepID=UPI00095106A6|nr:ricin-type beta-trefoil lectin domain protein [Streptomyces acidiscabies]